MDVLRENFRQALEVMRAHRLRSGLLILGVAIGVTTILAMVTVLSGLGRKINQDVVSANRPYLIVRKYDFFVGKVEEEKMRKRKDVEPEEADALAALCPTLDQVCYTASPPGGYLLHRKGRRTQPLQLLASAYTLPSIYSLAIDRGRFFTQEEERLRKRLVVLGYGPAEDLFSREDPIGKFVRIGSKRYMVVGTFARRKHIAGAMSDNFAVIPFTAYEKDFKSVFADASITATVKEGYTMEEGESQVITAMRIIRKLKPTQENDFSVTTSAALVEMVSKVTFYIGLVLIVIASIGLVVGGIGVMNIMLISVAERTREIGIRMALGAKRRDILQQFLIESATLTGMGGLAGTIFGVAFAFVVSSLIGFSYYFSPLWTAVAVLFSWAVGLIFGIYPAHRAAKMDPVVALRYE